MNFRWADAEHTSLISEDGLSGIPADPENAVYAAYLASGAIPLEYVAPAPAPIEVTRYQAKMALAAAGVLPEVEAAVAATGAFSPQSIAWAEARSFREDNPMILGLAAALGWPEGQVHALFVTAKALSL